MKFATTFLHLPRINRSIEEREREAGGGNFPFNRNLRLLYIYISSKDTAFTLQLARVTSVVAANVSLPIGLLASRIEAVVVSNPPLFRILGSDIATRGIIKK